MGQLGQSFGGGMGQQGGGGMGQPAKPNPMRSTSLPLPGRLPGGGAPGFQAMTPPPAMTQGPGSGNFLQASLMPALMALSQQAQRPQLPTGPQVMAPPANTNRFLDNKMGLPGAAGPGAPGGMPAPMPGGFGLMNPGDAFLQGPMGGANREPFGSQFNQRLV